MNGGRPYRCMIKYTYKTKKDSEPVTLAEFAYGDTNDEVRDNAEVKIQQLKKEITERDWKMVKKFVLNIVKL
jgi:hypothetical protein